MTINGIKLHKSITLDRVMDLAADDDGSGICLACGENCYGVEPDAEDYECEVCGEMAVMGAEQLLIHMA